MSYYEMTVYCNNCRKISSVQIPRGTRKDDVIDEAECPYCGVQGSLEFT